MDAVRLVIISGTDRGSPFPSTAISASGAIQAQLTEMQKQITELQKLIKAESKSTGSSENKVKEA